MSRVYAYNELECLNVRFPVDSFNKNRGHLGEGGTREDPVL